MNTLLQSGTPLRTYALPLVLVAASTLLGLQIAPRWGSSAVDLIFLPAVLASAILAGRGPAIAAAIASALAYNFFFTAPVHTFRIHSPADIVTVIVLFIVALVTSQLAASIRAQAEIARRHATRNATIAGFARQLLASADEPAIAAHATSELARIFSCNAVILRPRGELQVAAAHPASIGLNPSDLAVAALVAASGEAAGRGISPVMAIEWQFHAVSGADRVIAVAGLARDDGLPAVGRDQLGYSTACSTRSRWRSSARGWRAKRAISPRCARATACACRWCRR